MEGRGGPAAGLGEAILFFRRFLRSPRTVGAIAPSSRFLARAMAATVELRGEGRVVEFGPGTGAFTGHLSARLPHGGRYLGIERDPAFVSALEARFPALSFSCASVEELLDLAGSRGLLPIDAIVSGLPFASLPEKTTLPILEAAHSALRPEGTFATFQYVHAYPLPAARAFRREMRRLFGEPAGRRLVLPNIPPAFVLVWRKTA